MKEKYDVIIVGAGAAGLSAANCLLQKNNKINLLLIEKEDVPGRKLAASGNGKCNLSNGDYTVRHYHGSDNERLERLISDFSKEKIMKFVNELGILTYEKNGYYYPVSNQAKQVSSILMENAYDKGITYLSGARVNKIEKADVSAEQNRYRYQVSVKLQNNKTSHYFCEFLIIATGGLAAGALGGCDDGYRIAKKLDIKCSQLYPALAPIYVEDANLSSAKGVRIAGVVSLKDADGNIRKEKGQIQINKNGLSGICIMNLSGFVWRLSEEQRKDSLFLDCLPEFSWDDLKDYFQKRQDNFPQQKLVSVLSGIFPLPFVNYLMKRLSFSEEEFIGTLTDKNLNRLTSYIKKLTFTVCDYKKEKTKEGKSMSYSKDGFDEAQVTGGGVLLSEINIPSCESVSYSGLYMVGELLDVYGDCGGYNLTFAICSGLAAADDIVRKWKHD